MAILSTATATALWSQRRAAAEVGRDAIQMRRLIVFHGEVAAEYVNTASVSTAAEFGLSTAQLSALYHIDFATRIRLARAKVDADTTAPAYAELEAHMSGLRRLRRDVDAGRAPFSAVSAFFTKFDADIDNLLERRIEDARRRASTAENSNGLVSEQLDTIQATFTAFHTATERTNFANNLLTGKTTPANVAALIAADTRFSGAVAEFKDRLGPRAASAWRDLQLDPASRQVDEIVDQALKVGFVGGDSALAGDPTAYGAALIAAGDWVIGLTVVSSEASIDLNDLVRRLEAEDTRSLIVGLASALIAIAVAATAAAFTARAVARPARRLAASARRISKGEFSIPPLPHQGPRELDDTGRALNEVTATLTALEHYAIALAEDPQSSTLDRPLPGPTGQALQVAVDQLRDSVHDRERSRLTLQETATHDGLTGLLNRAAAIDAIARDLSRSERNDKALMVLFMDLDSFKAINDSHGHHVGDDALRLTADALRMATRLSDVVARFGGDEFLVCGFAADRAEVDAIAHRVHDAIASRTLSIESDQLTMHCSIGIALAESGDTAESLVGKADQALYLAKRLGRDQVAWHHPDPSLAADIAASPSTTGPHATDGIR